jgi:hypothetical protein
MSGINILRSGAIQHKPAGAVYTEQGVVANGSQYLTSPGLLGADTPSSILIFSGVADDLRGRVFGWSGTDGILSADTTGASGNHDPQMKWKISSGVTHTAVISPAVPLGARFHVICTSVLDGSNIDFQLAVWDATNGWRVDNSFKAGTALGLTTGAGTNYTLLARNNNSQNYSGTIYRLAFWPGVTADASDPTVQGHFFSGAQTVDPAVSIAQYGTPKFDAHGNAATWDSGNFAVGDDFTVTGDPFADAA